MYQARDDENLPLHKTLHFRRIRELIVDLADYENINLEDYDLNCMRAYRTMGINLRGRNVVTNVIGTNASPFVGNNHYDVIEIPNKKNSGKFTGNYIFLIKNTDFDYYLFGKMSVHIDYKKTKDTGKLIERVKFEVYGRYSISINREKEVNINKELRGEKCSYGELKETEKFFDSFGVRKKSYNINAQNLANKICNKSEDNRYGIIDHKKIKIYRKK